MPNQKLTSFDRFLLRAEDLIMTRLVPKFRREAGTGDMVIMAGWGGNTDWRKNIEANPRVHVQAGWTKFDALAEKLTDEEVADFLAEALRLNPRSERIWSRWAGEPVRAESRESLLRAAKFFPSFRLKKL
jgi:deazaflavin-dependent oxidoreductase (nitroreductase family)